MVGDDAVRFCCVCSRNVYDLTAMAPDDAELFLARHVSADDALPCGRIYRRNDGRVLTSECPAGASRRHLRRFAKTLAAGVVGAALVGGLADRAMRPELRPDIDEPETVERAPIVRMQMGGMVLTAPHSDGEPRAYDVDQALRSDESTRPEDLEPEGEGPARRRYVRDDPNQGVIRGTVSLVRDITDLSVRQRRRRVRDGL